MNNETTISKLLNGVNYGLNIANKAVPIYNQAKPLVKKGIDTYNSIKNSNNSISKYIKLFKLKNVIKNDMSKSTVNNSFKQNEANIKNTNNPTFFI